MMRQWFAITVLCASACRSLVHGPAGAGRVTAVAETDNRLLGAWRKDADTPCATRYPAQLRLEIKGLYIGATDPPGAFTWWDGGTWHVIAPDRLVLSTANDAVVEYKYELHGDVLKITDAGGCQFSYRRGT